MQHFCRHGRTTFFKLSLISLGVLLPQQAAFANESQQLDEVNVTTAADATSTEQTKSYTTSAMKTTTGLELSPKETPQSVSVITKTQLQHQGISRMEEALKTTTGVTVVREGSRYRYYSRGFGIEQIEENGISSTVPGAADNTFQKAQSMTDLSVYDHIEVVRGPTGLTQANGAPGGTINAVFKRPTINNQTQGSFLFDRFGKARTEFDISRGLSADNSVRGRFLTTLEHDPTFKDSDNNLGLIYGVVEADLGDASKLTLGAFHQRKRETPDPAGWVMGTDGSDLGLPYDRLLVSRWGKGVYNKTNVFGELEHFFNDDWKLSTKVAYVNSRSDEKFASLARRNSGDPSNVVRIGVIPHYQNKEREIAAKVNLTGKYRLLNQEHDVFLAYSYTDEKGSSNLRRAHREQSASFNPYTFAGHEIAMPDWSNLDFVEDANSRYKTHAVYGGTRFNPIDSLHLLIAGNFSWVKTHSQEVWINYLDRSFDGVSDTPTHQKRFTPYFGITWDLDEHNSLYASYTGIFKPSYGRRDKSGKQIPPKTGQNYEFGWKSEWYDGKLNTSLAIFQLDEKNRPISISKQMDPTALRGYTISAGKVRSRGWEAEISGQLTENWDVFLGYTYNFSKHLTRESNRILDGMNFSIHTPKHILRLHTNYRLPFDQRKWSIGGGVVAQSDVGSVNGLRQAGYAIWNGNIQYQMSKNIDLGIIVTNLTNKRYYQNHRTRNNIAGNYIGEPRNVMFQLNWKF